MGLSPQCAADTAGLKGLLETEYASGQQTLTPGRAFYAAAKENSGRLEWYPAMADLAGSGDLGFTSGPWIYTTAVSGTPVHGHFLTIWKRDAMCRWRAEFDGGISHAAPANREPKLEPDQAWVTKRSAPPPQLIADDAVSRAISDFRDTARQDGFASGLRTYARTADFRFYMDGALPMGLAAANRYFTGHAVPGGWKEGARGRSYDSTLAYSVGEFSDANHGNHAYAELWQYDPRVANWGLRILLIGPPAPLMSK